MIYINGNYRVTFSTYNFCDLFFFNKPIKYTFYKLIWYCNCKCAKILIKKLVGVGPFPFEGEAPFYALLEFENLNEEVEATAMRLFEACVERGWVLDGVMSQSLEQLKNLWRLREDISEAQRIEGVSIKHDVSVPVSRIPEFLERAGAALAARWPDVRVVAFGHIGDGNLHYNLSKPAA